MILTTLSTESCVIYKNMGLVPYNMSHREGKDPSHNSVLYSSECNSGEKTNSFHIQLIIICTTLSLFGVIFFNTLLWFFFFSSSAAFHLLTFHSICCSPLLILPFISLHSIEFVVVFFFLCCLSSPYIPLHLL